MYSGLTMCTGRFGRNSNLKAGGGGWVLAEGTPSKPVNTDTFFKAGVFFNILPSESLWSRPW